MRIRGEPVAVRVARRVRAGGSGKRAGRDPGTAPRVDLHWPYPDRRRPTPRILALLAEVYGTDVHHLLDLDDREHLTPADQLLISQSVRGSARAPDTGTPNATTSPTAAMHPPLLPEEDAGHSPAELTAILGTADAPPIEAATALRFAHEWLIAEPPQVVEIRTGRKVGEAFTRTVEGRVAQLRRLDDFVGGRDLYGLVERELAATVAVLGDAAYDERIGRRLLSAVAELCQLAGWVAMDAGHEQAARRHFVDGVRAAQVAGNQPVAANLISTLSYQFAGSGDPKTAVLLARTAFQGAQAAATATTLALLQERIAWAHARAGDRSAAEKALAAVERYYERRRPEDDPTWVYWLDDVEITVMAGRSYVELGLPERAEPLLTGAITRCDEDHAREVALYRSWLADAYIQMGELDRALDEARRVVELERRAGSARASQRVQYLRSRLARAGDWTARAFDFYQAAIEPLSPDGLE